MSFILFYLHKWRPSAPSLLPQVYRHPVLKMPSATDPLDTPHSDSDSERTLTASLQDYGDTTSARSPDATLLEGTLRTATVATGDQLFSDAPQRSPDATILTVSLLPRRITTSYVMMPSNVFSHARLLRICLNTFFSLDNEAMEELAAILHVTVAPSITTQFTHLHAYETISDPKFKFYMLTTQLTIIWTAIYLRPNASYEQGFAMAMAMAMANTSMHMGAPVLFPCCKGVRY